MLFNMWIWTHFYAVNFDYEMDNTNYYNPLNYAFLLGPHGERSLHPDEIR